MEAKFGKSSEVRRALVRASQTLSSMQRLATSAVEALPPAAGEWREFHAAVYVQGICLMAKNGHKAVKLFTDHAASETPLQGLLHIWKVVTEIMDQLFLNLSPFYEPGKRLTTVDSSRIASYFPSGRAPTEPLPADLVATLSLAIFRHLYPLLRRIFFLYADDSLRRRLKAWSPARATAADRIKGAERKATESFDSEFYDVFDSAILFLTILLRNSRPVRSRVAEDAGLIECLALCALAAPGLRKALFGGGHDFGASPAKELQEFAVDFNIPLEPLRFILGPHVKSYAKYRADRIDEGEFVKRAGDDPVRFLLNSLKHLWALNFNRPKKLRGARAETFEKLRDMIERSSFTLAAGLGIPPPPNFNIKRVQWDSDPEPSYAPETSNVTDACDNCDQPLPHDAKPKRCSRCRVARYCGRECQLVSWDKVAPAEQLEGALPLFVTSHKDLCMDAVPRPWTVEDRGVDGSLESAMANVQLN